MAVTEGLSTVASSAIAATFAAAMGAATMHSEVLDGVLTGNVWRDAAVATAAVNAAGFAVSAPFASTRVFDPVGAVGNLAIILTAVRNSRGSPRSQLLGKLAVAWVVRLGTFLAFRLARFGDDRRTAKFRRSPFFFVLWVLQSVWGYLTLLPVLTVASAEKDKAGEREEGSTCFTIGIALASAGLLLESAADHQKLLSKLNPVTPPTFISGGLWSLSRHPNYLGEVLMWVGAFVASTGVLKNDATLLSLSALSPLYVYAFLRYVSGVPILEKGADKQFGTDAAYQAYKASTGLIFPKLW